MPERMKLNNDELIKLIDNQNYRVEWFIDKERPEGK